MDNAVAASSNATLAAPGGPANGWVARVAALPQPVKLKLGLGVAVLLSVLVALALWSRSPDWKVLFTNLPDKEAGAIVAELSKMNTPYRLGEGGASILVPADKVHELRIRLATAGLPRSSVVGLESMDTPRLGQTQTQERIQIQRGLEGELTRTITSLQAVQAARVHLALPNQNGFFREQQKPSASVVLTLHPGRTLDRAQVAGIVHLVASSVPEMNPKAVSVLDASGSLLSGNDDNAAQGLDEKQLQYVRQMEATYLQRVMDILEPVVGRDNLRATVTADVDFSQTEQTAERFAPNQGQAPAAVRSQQSTEQTGPGAPVPTGVPGAASNQPPVPATAPINGASAPLQPATTGTMGGGSRREAITNYEVDKTVSVTRAATGTVRRLNAAVVVNHRSVTDAKGKTTTTPLPPEEVEKLTALVQEAIGFNKDRGDSVRLINAPFRETVEPEPEPTPLWQQPWLHDLLRAGAAPLALALVALGVVFGLVRPALRQAATPPPVAAAGGIDAVVDDDNELSADGTPALSGPAALSQNKLEQARLLARENPAAVAAIVREWVSGEPA
jgi:flagellar M-ring protein FliF